MLKSIGEILCRFYVKKYEGLGKQKDHLVLSIACLTRISLYFGRILQSSEHTVSCSISGLQMVPKFTNILLRLF